MIAFGELERGARVLDARRNWRMRHVPFVVDLKRPKRGKGGSNSGGRSMKRLIVAAVLGIAAVAHVPAEAATISMAPRVGGIPQKICSPGYSWQNGCLKWGPTPPGKLFGACVKYGWGCFRSPQPIQ